MKKAFGLVLVFSLLVPLGLQGQESPPAELQRLDWLVGEWSYGGEEGSWKCEWLGGFFVQCRDSFVFEAGERVTVLETWGYDDDEGVFTFDRYWSNGKVEAYKGWVSGNTWTFLSDETAEVTERFTMVEESQTAGSYKWEGCVKGGEWVLDTEGRFTKDG